MADTPFPISTGGNGTGGYDNSGGWADPNGPGTIYAGGKATQLANKGAFYNYIAANPGLGATEFSNNPWGVSAQEIQGIIGQPKQTGGTGGVDNSGLINSFNSQKSNIYSTADEAAANSGIGLKNNILDFIDSLKSGQGKIDTESANNDLAKIQGTQGVLGMVSRGIKSGGVMLSNQNAGSSSAAQALADAYGTLGRNQLSNVGNQYAQGQNNIQQEQNDFGIQQASGVRNLQGSKEQIINGIVSQAQNQLGQLDAAIAGASLPNRINIEQEKQAIRQKAMDALSQYDTLLNEGVGGVHAATGDDTYARATQMAQAGTAPDSTFNFDTAAPPQLQGSGPFASSLPLFTFRNKRTA